MESSGDLNREQRRALRRVSIADFLPAPTELTMPDGRVFVIEALGVNEMMELFSAERAMSGATNEDETLSPSERNRRMYEGLAEANRAIVAVLARRTPEGEPPPEYDLPPAAIGSMFAILAGQETVAAEIAETLQDASSPAETDGTADGAETGPEDASGAEDAPGTASDPLASTKRSPSSSSQSESSSTGDPAGGNASPGERSADTSATSESAAAA